MSVRLTFEPAPPRSSPPPVRPQQRFQKPGIGKVRMSKDAFLKAIQANPGDDAHPLIYADWLDDHGMEGGAAIRQHLGHQDSGLTPHEVLSGLIKTGIHPNYLDRESPRVSTSRYDHIASFPDDAGLIHELNHHIGSYRFSDHVGPVPVHRVVSHILGTESANQGRWGLSDAHLAKDVSDYRGMFDRDRPDEQMQRTSNPLSDQPVRNQLIDTTADPDVIQDASQWAAHHTAKMIRSMAAAGKPTEAIASRVDRHFSDLSRGKALGHIFPQVHAGIMNLHGYPGSDTHGFVRHVLGVQPLEVQRHGDLWLPVARPAPFSMIGRLKRAVKMQKASPIRLAAPLRDLDHYLTEAQNNGKKFELADYLTESGYPAFGEAIRRGHAERLGWPHPLDAHHRGHGYSLHHTNGLLWESDALRDAPITLDSPPVAGLEASVMMLPRSKSGLRKRHVISIYPHGHGMPVGEDYAGFQTDDHQLAHSLIREIPRIRIGDPGLHMAAITQLARGGPQQRMSRSDGQYLPVGKQDGCTCDHPEKILKNGSGHGYGPDGKPCPHHRAWLEENIFGRPKKKKAVQNARADELPADEQEAFHRAIEHNPHDAAPRLIYADWLEEHGLGAHAHVIRQSADKSSKGFDGDLFPAKGNSLISRVLSYRDAIGDSIRPHHAIQVFFASPNLPGRSFKVAEHWTHDEDLNQQFRSEMSAAPHSLKTARELHAQRQADREATDRLNQEWGEQQKMSRVGKPVRMSHAQFASAINANPDDDAPKLVYADWLDEHGMPWHAKAIRSGVKAEHPAEKHNPNDYYDAGHAQTDFAHDGLLYSIYAMKHRDNRAQPPHFHVHLLGRGVDGKVAASAYFHTNDAEMVHGLMSESKPKPNPTLYAELGIGDKKGQLRRAVRSAIKRKSSQPQQMSRGTPVRMSESAFRRAIRVNHDDDAPKLIYADWLDEHGRPDEAAAVRHLAQFRGTVPDGHTPETFAKLLHSAGVHGWRTMDEWQPIISRHFAVQSGGHRGWNAPVEDVMNVRQELLDHLRSVGDPRADIVAADTATRFGRVLQGGDWSFGGTLRGNLVHGLGSHRHDTGEGPNPDRHAYGQPLSSIDVDVYSRARRGPNARKPSAQLGVGWSAHTAPEPLFANRGNDPGNMVTYPVGFDASMSHRQLRDFADRLPLHVGSPIHIQLDRHFPHTRSKPETFSMKDRLREAIRMSRGPVRLHLDDDPLLLRAAGANPWDDAPHLILADSLDEWGSPFGQILRDYATGKKQSNYWNWRDTGPSPASSYAPYNAEDDDGIHHIGTHGHFHVHALPSGFAGDTDAPLVVSLTPIRRSHTNQLHYHFELNPHETRDLAGQLPPEMGAKLEFAARKQWFGLRSQYSWAGNENPSYDEFLAQPRPEQPDERMSRAGDPVRLGVPYPENYRLGNRPGWAHVGYDQLNAWLGKRNERRLASNKQIVRDPDGDIHTVLHNTPVVTAHADGTYTLRSGGFRSQTTANTISTFSPHRQGWGANSWGGFFDGIRVGPSGENLTESLPHGAANLMEEANRESRYAPLHSPKPAAARLQLFLDRHMGNPDPEHAMMMDHVLANHEDSAPWLIYSDWLEERGHGKKAASIRRHFMDKQRFSMKGVLKSAIRMQRVRQAVKMAMPTRVFSGGEEHDPELHRAILAHPDARKFFTADHLASMHPAGVREIAAGLGIRKPKTTQPPPLPKRPASQPPIELDPARESTYSPSAPLPPVQDGGPKWALPVARHAPPPFHKPGLPAIGYDPKTAPRPMPVDPKTLPKAMPIASPVVTPVASPVASRIAPPFALPVAQKAPPPLPSPRVGPPKPRMGELVSSTPPRPGPPPLPSERVGPQAPRMGKLVGSSPSLADRIAKAKAEPLDVRQHGDMWLPVAKRLSMKEKLKVAVRLQRGEPVRMASVLSDHGMFLRGISMDNQDHASPLIYSDWLEEHGKPTHAKIIRTHLAQSPEWSFHHLQPAKGNPFSHEFYDDTGRGDLFRHLILHPGQTHAHAYEGPRTSSLTVTTAIPPPRTKVGSIKKQGWLPRLAGWTASYDNVDELMADHAALIAEGAIGTSSAHYLRPWEVENWPARGVGERRRRLMRDRLKSAIRLQRSPVRFAAFRDRGIDVTAASNRIGSANHQDLVNVLRTTLSRSGLTPHRVFPAIHDFAGSARPSAVAEVFGETRPGAANYGAAWEGLIAKQPSLVVFRSHPEGADSVYKVAFKGPQKAFSQLLDSVGVANRVYVPHKDGTHAYLYDPQRKLRDNIGGLVSQLGLQALEHVGTGEPVGGGDDMGRAQYRDEIQKAESGQQPNQQMARDPNKPYKFANTQIAVEGEAAKKILEIAQSIPDELLADDGREDKPHITVLYGLHPEVTGDDVVDVAHEFGRPIRGKISKLSAFYGDDTGKDYDVLKFDVESDDLHKLNAAFKKLPHTSSFPDYHPHATVAYVKKGEAKKFVDAHKPLDAEFEAGRLTFSAVDKQKKSISLTPGERFRNSRDDSPIRFAAEGIRRAVLSGSRPALALALHQHGMPSLAQAVQQSPDHPGGERPIRSYFAQGPKELPLEVGVQKHGPTDWQLHINWAGQPVGSFAVDPELAMRSWTEWAPHALTFNKWDERLPKPPEPPTGVRYAEAGLGLTGVEPRPHHPDTDEDLGATRLGPRMSMREKLKVAVKMSQPWESIPAYRNEHSDPRFFEENAKALLGVAVSRHRDGDMSGYHDLADELRLHGKPWTARYFNGVGDGEFGPPTVSPWSFGGNGVLHGMTSGLSIRVDKHPGGWTVSHEPNDPKTTPMEDWQVHQHRVPDELAHGVSHEMGPDRYMADPQRAQGWAAKQRKVPKPPLYFARDWQSGGSTRNPFYESKIGADHAKALLELAASRHEQGDRSVWPDLADELLNSGHPWASTAVRSLADPYAHPGKFVPDPVENWNLLYGMHGGRINGLDVAIKPNPAEMTWNVRYGIGDHGSNGFHHKVDWETGSGLLHEIQPEGEHDAQPLEHWKKIAERPTQARFARDVDPMTYPAPGPQDGAMIRYNLSDHPDLIMRHVAAQPGITLDELWKNTPAGKLTAPLQQRAIKKLTDTGQLKIFREDAGPGTFRTRLFPADHPIPEAMVPSKLDQIVGHFKAGMANHEIAKTIGVTRQRVYQALKSARRRKLLEREGEPVKMNRALSPHDIDQFAQAIHQSPGDDAPRLIMADYLEENGFPAAAHAARIGQSESEAIPKQPHDWDNRVGTAHGWLGDEALGYRRPSLLVSTRIRNGDHNQLHHWVNLTVPATLAAGRSHTTVANFSTADHEFVRSLLSELGERQSIGDDRHPIWDAIDRLAAANEKPEQFSRDDDAILFQQIADALEPFQTEVEAGRPIRFEGADEPVRFAKLPKAAWLMTPEELDAARTIHGNQYLGEDESYYGDAPREDPYWLKNADKGQDMPPGGPDDTKSGWVPVQSSWLIGIRRLKGLGTTVDMMTKKGKAYRYNLPRGAFWRWLASTSKGRWWHANVRGLHSPAQKLSLKEIAKEAIRLQRCQ